MLLRAPPKALLQEPLRLPQGLPIHPRQHPEYLGQARPPEWHLREGKSNGKQNRRDRSLSWLNLQPRPKLPTIQEGKLRGFDYQFCKQVFAHPKGEGLLR